MLTLIRNAERRLVTVDELAALARTGLDGWGLDPAAPGAEVARAVLRDARGAAYPSVANQLDLLYHSLKAAGVPAQSWFDAVEAVKAALPLPSVPPVPPTLNSDTVAVHRTLTGFAVVLLAEHQGSGGTGLSVSPSGIPTAPVACRVNGVVHPDRSSIRLGGEDLHIEFEYAVAPRNGAVFVASLHDPAVWVTLDLPAVALPA
jgi:hypothetical protein